MSRLEMEERMMKNEEERKNTIKDFCENYRKRSEKKGRKWQNLKFSKILNFTSIINLSLYRIIVINVSMDSINSLESMERIVWLFIENYGR